MMFIISRSKGSRVVGIDQTHWYTRSAAGKLLVGKCKCLGTINGAEYTLLTFIYLVRLCWLILSAMHDNIKSMLHIKVKY